MYAQPGESREATVSGFPTGQAASITFSMLDNQGGETFGPSSAGVIEIDTGIYARTFTAPSTQGQYTIVWTYGTQKANDDLEVTYSAPGAAVITTGDAWITTSDLSSAMGGAAVDATRGSMVCEAACDVIRLATEQNLYPVVEGGTVTLDGTGTDALLLPQRPTLAAGTVIESGGTLVADTNYVLNDNAILFRKPGVIDSGWGAAQCATYWWPGRQNIVVTYDHGYDADTLPSDLRELAIQMAKRLYSANGNVTFEQLGQRQIRYSGAASDFTTTERLIIRKYKVAK